MNVFIIILLVIAGLYLLFALIPSLIVFFYIFGRRKANGLEAVKGTYLEPYSDEILDASRYFEALEHEELTMTARDGVSLYADYYRTGTGKTAILMHGYGATPMLNFAIQARELHKAGFGILFVTQRAHGKSGGKRCGLGLIEQYDLEDWISLMLDKGEKELLLYGISMGSSTIAYASERLTDPRIKAMVLDCGFDSPCEQLRSNGETHHKPWWIMLPHFILFAKLFLKTDIRRSVKSSLKNAVVPAFFLHGDADRTVAHRFTEENARVCASTKGVAIVSGAEHTMAYYAGDPCAREKLGVFLAECFGTEIPHE